MTALNASFFFWGSKKEDILFSAAMFFSHIFVICGPNLSSLQIAQVLGDFYSIEYKVTILSNISGTYLMVFFHI